MWECLFVWYMWIIQYILLNCRSLFFTEVLLQIQCSQISSGQYGFSTLLLKSCCDSYLFFSFSVVWLLDSVGLGAVQPPLSRPVAQNGSSAIASTRIGFLPSHLGFMNSVILSQLDCRTSLLRYTQVYWQSTSQHQLQDVPLMLGITWGPQMGRHRSAAQCC